jgi:DNA-binding PucR family transcriptional regulator
MVTQMSAHVFERRTTPAQLLEILGGAGLRLASAERDHPLPLTGSVFYDPLAPPTGRRTGILLGIGLHPDSVETEEAIRSAAECGFGAVAIKARSRPVDQIARVADAGGIALLIVDDEIEWRQLGALLDSALATPKDGHGSLSTLAVGDLFALANAIAAMVGGATTIEDLQDHVLAYSTLPGQTIDEDRRESILGRQVPDLPENPEQYSLIFQAAGAIKLRSEPPALPRLAVAVRAGSQLLGSIWVVDSAGDLDIDAERALERAADIAALHMLSAQSAADVARQQRSELLRRVLEGGDDAHLIGKQLGLGPAGPFVVVAFQPEFTNGVDELTVARFNDLVATQCEASYPGTQCAVIGDTIYALFAGIVGFERSAAQSLAHRLVQRAAIALKLEVRVSIGSVASRVARISKSRHEADLVLLLLAQRKVRAPVASADDVRSELALLELAQGFREPLRRVSPAATRVLDWDSQHGTEYAKTLGAYLRNSRDSASTATELSIHPNTLRYRLRRARELLGIDLENPDDTLILWLGLRMAEFD